jgi:hypothetical protein
LGTYGFGFSFCKSIPFQVRGFEFRGIQTPSPAALALLLVFLLQNLCTAGTAHAASSAARKCSAELTSLIDKAFHRFTSLESDEQRAQALLKLLMANRTKIEARVGRICPHGSFCPPATLVHAVVTAVEEEIAELESPNVKVGWRVWFTVGTSVLTYVGLSTAAQSYMTSISATMAVAFLTYFGTSALDAVGAPVLEYILPPVRRWMYANNNLAFERDLARGSEQQRHRLFHMLQQELVSETEANGRTTDTEVILRLLTVLDTCSVGNCNVARERSAEILAKLITHVFKHYPEIDLRHSDYAEWVQALFAKWEVPAHGRTEFIRQILDRIENHYDLRARNEPARRKKYEAILISWFALEDNPMPTQFDIADGI